MEVKIKNREEIVRTLSQWRVKSDKIVFTNGCFDVLHAGHIHTLQEAKKLGNKLVLGLNSDASIKRLKGETRPINTEQNRSIVLAALSCIDAIVVFEEDTPLDLIQLIQPDFLVKGGDWETNQIVGADFVLKQGGSVQSISFVDGLSTTETLEKILNLG